MNALVTRLRALSRHKAATAIVMALVVSLLAVYAVQNISFLTGAERFVQDWEVATRVPLEPQDSNIVVVGIGETAMQHFAYREPLNRGFLADLLTAIDAKHPKAIVLDYLFDQPTEPANDARLKAAIRNAEAPLVISYFEAGGDASAQQVAYLDSFVPQHMRAIANGGTDQTDTARWIVPGRKGSNGEYLLSVPRRVAQIAGVQTPDKEVPIVWRGDEGVNQPAFREIPACFAITDGCLPMSMYPAGAIRDKIVLIGSDLTLVDHHRTPFATQPGNPNATMPGIMIQAYAVAQLIEHRDPPQLEWWEDFLIVLLFAGLGAGLGVLELPLWLRAGGVVVAIAVLWGLGVFVLYEKIGIIIGLIAPTIAVAGAFAAVDSLAGLDARRQREFIRSTFSLYLAPELVKELEDDPSKLRLGGERRDMSLLFTDIAGFTTMAEGLDSQEVGRVLNNYLDGMTSAVKKHGGFVDKFIGDAVMAIFNAPVTIEDYATRCVRCMLDLDSFTEMFRKKMNAEGVPLGVTRIGVHTGAAAVGNFGSRDKFSYTASGDAVNAASRLEGLNKTFGTRLCVSGATKMLCKGIAFRPIGSVILKGKTEALDVWEPLHDGTYDKALLDRYVAAFQAASDHKPEAADLFDKLAADAPDDPLVQFYLARLREGETGVKIKMTEK
ncbi:MAG TPA: adenylate/guanylate cyclase domain-containing protein [Rhizomicrobium sp.]|jgi:class 3 adenylate cyclase|nr:adenylate/guanylate cyclase domain-containing protein [Rhizomicrobium sp.]